MVKIRKNIENMEIYEYMKDLNENIWEYFFDDSLAHETIFHSLNELEQIIISRLLFIQQVVSERAMRLWINPHFLKNLSEGIKNLVDAKILIGSETKKDNYSQYKINEKFRFTLLNKIYKCNENNIFIFNYNIKEQMEKEKNLYQNNLFPSKEEIFNYAQTKWNNLLHFIASPKMSNLNTYIICNNNEENKHTNIDYAYPNNFKNYDMNKKKSVYRTEHYNPFKKSENQEEEYEEDQHKEESYEEDQYDEEQYGVDEQEEEQEEDVDKEEEESKESYNDYGIENNNYICKNNYASKYNNANINRINNENINQVDYYKRRKKKKKKHIYAYKQNELYYKSLQNKENNFVEGEEENNNSFFFQTEKENFSYIPCDSVIEVLKRKNFILDDVNNNKTISMSREAFSWFLKDLRSRIMSLVLEYLLMIDDGYVTSIAQEVSIKYKRKNNIDNSNSNNYIYEKDGDNSPTDSSYVTKKNKESKKSEIYIKETLLLILSISQCNISQPIFLDNLTKAQKEFIDFGMHIGLFYKPLETCIFITPYALLLNINNANTQYYLSLLSNITVEGLCDDRFKKNLSEKYFHSYLLLQEKKQMINKTSEEKGVQMMNQEKITNKLLNESLYSGKKVNENDNLEIGLIVQSNFKVYLYTSSLLKINILSHLCELQTRTPNMVVGVLTRRSVLNAYNSDITANQIIKFLESYSHPCKNNLKSTIPINVITQLKLWESERHRLTFEDAIVFKSFEKEFLPHLYQQIVIWANSKNYLLYYTPWPKNNSKEFDFWLKSEKYLCCIYESKNEIIDKIKEIREKLLKKK